MLYSIGTSLLLAIFILQLDFILQLPFLTWLATYRPTLLFLAAIFTLLIFFLQILQRRQKVCQSSLKLTHKLTAEDYKKMKKGMTEFKVEQLLSSPQFKEFKEGMRQEYEVDEWAVKELLGLEKVLFDQ